MRKLFAALILFSSLCHAQGFGGKGGIGGKYGFGGGIAPTLAPGWTYNQLNGPSISGAGTCTTACASIPIFPTVANAVLIVSTAQTNDVTIAASGGWSIDASSHCHIRDTVEGVTVDTAYIIAPTPGTTTLPTVSFSGDPGTVIGLTVGEVVPPAGYTAQYDGCAAVHNTGCSTCTAAAPPISNTDAVIHFVACGNCGLSSGVGAFPWTPASYSTFAGAQNGIGLNINTSTPPTVTQGSSSWFIDSALSVGSNAGAFTPPAQPLSISSAPENGPNQQCTTASCPFPFTTTPTQALPAGDACVIWDTNSSTTSHYISTMTGCGTWVVPAGCQASSSTGGSISCAYNLNLGSSCIGEDINGTFTANDATTNTWLAGACFHRTSGSWTYGGSNSATDATSLTPAGVSVSGCGANNAVYFQGIEVLAAVLPSTQTLYWQPAYGGGSNQNANSFGSNAALVNSTNTTAPTWWLNPQTTEPSVVAGICLY